ncbi:YidC/Oxa1 family membrane protein insertase [Thermosyntropha sp.]|uniref:YidC/Oxa1 family membrane protein insertase n=1 Tax=Thermosyntropha sp. TaxID=2740820 RepID=UPI0025FD8227|nr:YidC/Oxa1 family membrane protein insertase [Thermosyntropha sp.]
MWQSFVHWFTNFIEFMYGVTIKIGLPNYGLAIILMTIVIKLVLFPLTQKQLKSMRAMQELQPKLKYIQEKYQDDPQKMQAKVMELYKEHGVNPFGGCLPLLIQMPIFIAFYQSLYNFKFTVAEHAAFLGIPNISQTAWYLITHGDPVAVYLPILAGLTTYIQQRVSMINTDDPTQKSMLYFMPLFMAWIATTLPAGLPIYWIMFNILGILQQLYVNKSSQKTALNVREK